MSPNKHSSPVKRKSPRKGQGKRNTQLLKVKVTPPKKTFRSPSPVVGTSSRKHLPDVCGQSKSPKKPYLPTPKRITKHKNTGAHGSDDSEQSPEIKPAMRKTQKKDETSPIESSSSMNETPEKKPIMDYLGLSPKTRSRSMNESIKVKVEEPSTRKKGGTGKLSLSNKNKHVSWNLGKTEESPIEISPSSEDHTPVRGTSRCRRTQLSEKFSPPPKKNTQSPSGTRKKKNKSQSPSADGDQSVQQKCTSSEAMEKSHKISPRPRKAKSSPKIKYTSDFEDDLDDSSDQVNSSPQGATSNTDDDEALIRSTDLRPESKSITQHLSELDNHSPNSSDSSDSSGDLPTRSSGGNKWTYAKIVKLCSMWEQEPHLYDPSHPQYLNKKLKLKAHHRMATALNLDGKNAILKSTKI